MIHIKNMRSNDKLAIASFALFGFFLIIGLLFSELYQAPLREKNILHKFTLVLVPQDLADLSKITINNEQGDFQMQKSTEGEWALTAPKEFLVNAHLMGRMLEELSHLKILSMIEADTINLNNYLLSNSKRKIVLTNSKNEEIVIMFGMNNTINNSTYIFLPERKVIYQIESPQIAFANLDLALLIENKVFQMQSSDVVEFSLYQGAAYKQDARLSLNWREDKWLNKKGQDLSTEKVLEFLQKTLSTKSFFILDQVSSEQENELNKHFSQPSFEVIVKNKNVENNLRYTISPRVKSLKNLDLPEESVFIKQSQSKLLYVVSVKNLDFLDIKESDLKALPIKKLFY